MGMTEADRSRIHSFILQLPSSETQTTRDSSLFHLEGFKETADACREVQGTLLSLASSRNGHPPRVILSEETRDPVPIYEQGQWWAILWWRQKKAQRRGRQRAFMVTHAGTTTNWARVREAKRQKGTATQDGDSMPRIHTFRVTKLNEKWVENEFGK